jgi:glycosyltransferase involved in cell wall biosynthesis
MLYVLREDDAQRQTFAAHLTAAAAPMAYLTPSGGTPILRAIWMLWRTFSQRRPHIVHAHLPDAVIAAGIVSVLRRIPFVIHEHQSHQMHSWKVRLAYRLLRPFSARTIYYTGSLEQELFGTVHDAASGAQSCTIENGIDTDALEAARQHTDCSGLRASFGWRASDIVVCCVARITAWKGQHLLLEAFARAAADMPDLRLLLVGDGDASALQSRARELGITERVALPGGRTDIPDILAASDIFSLVFAYPAGKEAEAIGVAGLEAMAAGLPAVIGDYPSGLPLVDGREVVKVPPRDVAALSLALQRLGADHQLRHELGERGRAFVVRRLAWNAIMPAYESLYLSIAHV